MPINSISSFIILYILGFVAIMYFAIIRPAKKKNKEKKEMHNSLKVGDEINTIGGIYGKVVAINGEDISLLIDEKTNTTIKIVIYAVQGIVKKA